MANNHEKNGEYEVNRPEVSKQKQILNSGITGKVKWFNVKRGYGFVCRNDNNEDIFIHQSAIVKSNPDHPRKSVGEGEEIMFDIVKGAKGNEAANVSATDGTCVKGSDYALRYPRSRGRGGRGTFRGRSGANRSRIVSEEGDMRSKEFYRGSSGPGETNHLLGDMRSKEFYRGSSGGVESRGGRSFRRPYVVQYRKPSYPYDMPAQFYYEYDYYRGPLAAGGGPRGAFRGGRGYRNGGPRETQMKFESPYESEYFERRAPPAGRGRIRGGRGRGRGRGGQRNNSKVNDGKEEEEEQQQQHDE